MTDSNGRNGLSLKQEIARWYARRLATVFRRATNQGLGAYVLFALALLGAAITVRVAAEGVDEDREYVSALLSANSQPQSEVTRSTVLGLLLLGLRSKELDGSLSCRGTNAQACKAGNALFEELQARLNKISASTDSGWNAAVALPTPDANSASCDTDEAAASKRRDRASRFTLSAPACYAGTHSVELIPQQVADAASSMDPNNDKLAYRIWRARRVGLEFESTIHSMVGQLEAASDRLTQSDGPTVAAAFVVSVDSVLRYWAPGARPSLGDFPPYRAWAARPYVENILKSNSVSGAETTLPYMDFAGNGIVATECRPLTVPSATLSDAFRSESLPADPVVVSVFCLDYGLSERSVGQLVEALNRSPLIRAALVHFREVGSGRLGFSEAPMQAFLSGNLELQNSILENAEVQQGSPDRRREISSLGRVASTDYGSTFYIPIQAAGGMSRSAIVLQVRGIGPFGSRPVEMGAALFFLLASAGSFFFVFRSSKETARRESLLGRLRSLQVAVVQTDVTDQITAGNDLAEDLIGVRLPTFGLNDTEPVKLASEFELNSILVQKAAVSDESMFELPEPSTLVRETLSYITNQRLAGTASQYFVRLSKPRSSLVIPSGMSPNWLRVRGGPIFQPGDASSGSGDDLQATFGTLTSVSEDYGKMLQSRSDHLTSTSTSSGGTKS